MDTFYVAPEDVHGQSLTLRGDEAQHLSRSLRKRVGDHIYATDGNDNLFEAVVSSLDRDEVQCEVAKVEMGKNEPKTSITLAISLLRNPARFDFVIEKATELGVRSIIPLACERTIGRGERHERYEKLALAAMKQSNRCYLPRIFPLSSVEAVAKHAAEGTLKLIPHERTEQSQFIGAVLQHHENVRSALILVGPEGGFTDEELDVTAAHAFVPVSLGPRRLRSETAAISAVSWVVGGM